MEVKYLQKIIFWFLFGMLRKCKCIQNSNDPSYWQCWSHTGNLFRSLLIVNLLLINMIEACVSSGFFVILLKKKSPPLSNHSQPHSAKSVLHLKSPQDFSCWHTISPFLLSSWMLWVIIIISICLQKEMSFHPERKVPFSNSALCLPPHRMSGVGDCLIDAIEKMLSRNVLLSLFGPLSSPWELPSCYLLPLNCKSQGMQGGPDWEWGWLMCYRVKFTWGWGKETGNAFWSELQPVT